ncbi:MAG: hypothetical protein IPK22_07510 [Verrucomicrobiaceae bacterium]|nr:hypothetical protein [Verrucomicrobiaceae bacterium]
MKYPTLKDIAQCLESCEVTEDDKEELELIRQIVGRRLADIEDQADTDYSTTKNDPICIRDVWEIDLGYKKKIRAYLVIAVPNDKRNLAILVPSTSSLKGSAFEVARSTGSKKSAWNIPGILSLDHNEIRCGRKVGTICLEEFLMVLRGIDAALELFEQLELLPRQISEIALQAQKPKGIRRFIDEMLES